MITISVKADIRALERRLDDLAKRQMPFASARAVTEVAKRVRASATVALPKILDRPTPFTMNTFAVKSATKASPTAIVYARPIQAAYLAPEEFGLPQKVAKVALLNPVDIRTNQYGNLPAGILQRLKAGGDVFIGTVKGVYGVWQRVGMASERGRVGRYRKAPAIPARMGGLRLLIRFKAPVVPQTRLGFRERALAQVKAEIGPELRRQLAAALKTAR